MKKNDKVMWRQKKYTIHKIDGKTVTLTNEAKTEYIGVSKDELKEV